MAYVNDGILRQVSEPDKKTPLIAHRGQDISDLNFWTQEFNCLSDIIGFQDKYTEANLQRVKLYLEWYNPKNSDKAKFLGGFGTVDKTIRNLILGPPKIFKLLEQMREEVEKKLKLKLVPRPRKKLIRNGEGEELDIHQVLSGNLGQAWEERRMGKKEAEPKVHLVLARGCLVYVKQDKLLDCSLAGLILADYLIKSGINVKISYLNVNIGTFARQSSVYVGIQARTPVKMGTLITVKQYGKRFNRRLLASLGSVGFHRALLFPTYMCLPRMCDTRMGSSFTKWRHCDTNELAILNQLTGQGADRVIYIDNFALYGSGTRHEPEYLIKQTLDLLKKDTRNKYLNPGRSSRYGEGIFLSQADEVPKTKRLIIPRGRLYEFPKKHKGQAIETKEGIYAVIDELHKAIRTLKQYA